MSIGALCMPPCCSALDFVTSGTVVNRCCTAAMIRALAHCSEGPLVVKKGAMLSACLESITYTQDPSKAPEMHWLLITARLSHSGDACRYPG